MLFRMNPDRASLTFYNAWLSSHRRPQTVKNRLYYARRLTHWAEERGQDFTDLSVQDLTEWLTTVGPSPSTRKNAADGARSLYRWATLTGITQNNPATDLPHIRVPRGMPRPTPDAVLRRGIERATRHTDILMLMLGSYGGLRVAEIAGLHTNDILGNQLRILGKGGHVRLVPISPLLKPLLEATPAGWCFPSDRNPTGHYKPASIGQRIHDLLDDGWSAHTLRHRFATEVYRATADLLALRELLGHVNVSTTQIYARVAQDKLTHAVDTLPAFMELAPHMRRTARAG